MRVWEKLKLPPIDGFTNIISFMAVCLYFLCVLERCVFRCVSLLLVRFAVGPITSSAFTNGTFLDGCSNLNSISCVNFHNPIPFRGSTHHVISTENWHGDIGDSRGSSEWPSLKVALEPKFVGWDFFRLGFPRMGVPHSWMVYSGKSYYNGWFGGYPHRGRKLFPHQCDDQ